MEKKVLVSACLLGISCKYNGENNRNQNVLDFLDDKDFVPICPEQLGGLPTPRIPAEQKENLVITKDGDDVTINFLNGAKEALKICNMTSCTSAILKARSPSCGFGKVYDGSFSGVLTNGNGVFAQMLYNRDFPILTEEDL